MQAIMTYFERINGQLEGDGKLLEGKTKKDIRLFARNMTNQMDARLTDIIFDDSPYWQDYIKNLNPHLGLALPNK